MYVCVFLMRVCVSFLMCVFNACVCVFLMRVWFCVYLFLMRVFVMRVCVCVCVMLEMLVSLLIGAYIVVCDSTSCVCV